MLRLIQEPWSRRDRQPLRGLASVRPDCTAAQQHRSAPVGDPPERCRDWGARRLRPTFPHINDDILRSWVWSTTMCIVREAVETVSVLESTLVLS
jgi:hypothetical protein